MPTGLDMYFTVSVASAGTGEVREQDLLPGGSKRLVTEENKHQYVQLLVEWCVKEEQDQRETRRRKGGGGGGGGGAGAGAC